MSKLMNRILLAAAVVAVSSSAFAQISEDFDDITLLVPGGWNMQNLSTPVGTTGWFQGNTAVFPPHATTGYIGANFNNTAGTGTISNWLLTPEISLQNGAMWSFWTRTVDAPAFPDRLHLKMSTNGGSTNVGDFTTVLVSINNGLTTTGYPNAWTEFSGTISGLGGPVQGRLAFHYDVPQGGPTGANSDYIGIDTFDYNPVPEPGTIAVVALGLGALMLRRRKA
jgi:hypothetical protein